MPGDTALVVRAHGHLATDVRDIGLGTASDDEIAEYARLNGFAIISADRDFGDERVFPPANYSGIVIIEQPPIGNVRLVLALVDQFLSAHNFVSMLPGRIAIVAPGRIRMRPALSP